MLGLSLKLSKAQKPDPLRSSRSTLAMSAIHAILSNPRYHDYLAILKGARNGFVYGVKVRFPHALVMAVLFGRGEYVYSRGWLPFSSILLALRR